MLFKYKQLNIFDGKRIKKRQKNDESWKNKSDGIIKVMPIDSSRWFFSLFSIYFVFIAHKISGWLPKLGKVISWNGFFACDVIPLQKFIGNVRLCHKRLLLRMILVCTAVNCQVWQITTSFLTLINCQSFCAKALRLLSLPHRIDSFLWPGPSKCSHKGKRLKEKWQMTTS